MINTMMSYQLVARDMAKSIERVQSQAAVERETAYYLENIEKVKSAEDLVDDYRLFNYAMKAFGLSDMAYGKALMVKAMEEGIDEPDTFANKMADKRYREFVEVFNFARHGERTTIFEVTRQGTVDRYYRQTLEEQAGEQNEGVRLALYFERKAGTITSAFSILADKALAEVVRTALAIPDSVAAGDIDKQAAMIEEKLDIEGLKDPEKLSKFIQRFTAMWEIENASSARTEAIVSMFQPVEYGVSTDLLMAIASIRK